MTRADTELATLLAELEAEFDKLLNKWNMSFLLELKQHCTSRDSMSRTTNCTSSWTVLSWSGTVQLTSTPTCTLTMWKRYWCHSTTEAGDDDLFYLFLSYRKKNRSQAPYTFS
jgi:hypothetical protein